jgi:hypothetical protein
MLKYLGGSLRGVPKRDLKDDEVKKYGYSYLVRSGFYAPMKHEAVKPKIKKENKHGRHKIT